MALSQEGIGDLQEDHFLLLHHASLLSFFPGRNEQSRSNRCTRDLWAVILAVRVRVHIVLEALRVEETAAIDLALAPV